MIMGIWPLYIYIPVEQEVMAGKFHASSHSGVCVKKSKYEWEYTSEIFYS